MATLRNIYVDFLNAAWWYIVCPAMARWSDTMDRARRAHASVMTGHYDRLVLYRISQDQPTTIYDYSFSLWSLLRVCVWRVVDPDLGWLVKTQSVGHVHHHAAAGTCDTVVLGKFVDDHGHDTVHVLALPLRHGEEKKSVVSSSSLDIVYCVVDEALDITHGVEAVRWMLRDNRAWTWQQMIRMLSTVFPACRDLRSAVERCASAPLRLCVIDGTDCSDMEFVASDLFGLRSGDDETSSEF